MFGFSVFMTDEIDHETEGYIGSMKAQGFQGIFTSAHIPEEDGTKLRTGNRQC